MQNTAGQEMMLLVAEVAGLDASGITAVRSPPATSLPRDTQPFSQHEQNGLLAFVPEL